MGGLTYDKVCDKINIIHGSRYKFPNLKLEYQTYLSELSGICDIHGEFKTTLGRISQGRGCTKCGRLLQQSRVKSTPQQALERICNTYGDRYEFPYIENEYDKVDTKITAICPKHGEFKTTVNTIMNGHGCKLCGNENGANKRSLSHEQVCNKLSTSQFGCLYKFPYIELEYIDSKSKITAICEEHGLFTTTFDNIVNMNTGCQTCARIRTVLARRNVKTQIGLADYESFSNRLLITDGATEGPYGELQVRCKMCQQLMTPTLVSVHQHIRCINGLDNGESNFYCSEKCKSECTIFGKSSNWVPIMITDYEAKVREARRCQAETKHRLRQIQMSLYGYHFCEKCGVVVENNQLHHTIEVAKDPVGALSPAGHMLVCEPCHKEFTARCR